MWVNRREWYRCRVKLFCRHNNKRKKCPKSQSCGSKHDPYKWCVKIKKFCVWFGVRRVCFCYTIGLSVWKSLCLCATSPNASIWVTSCQILLNPTVFSSSYQILLCSNLFQFVFKLFSLSSSVLKNNFNPRLAQMVE